MNNEKKIITLATLADATAQEVFDQVAHHLLTQNQKSVNVFDDEEAVVAKEACLYRGISISNKVLKCAAGCLISDEEYEKLNTLLPEGTIEHNGWNSLVHLGLLPEAHFLLISNLQAIHDNSDVDYWTSSLINFAKQWKLDYSIVEEHLKLNNYNKHIYA